ncbi:MAG: methyltransferase [Clostridiales bacterium]|jgi:phospholipid N-methyltransferase|nr:methyltransferase [Clostridiales bacterium]
MASLRFILQYVTKPRTTGAILPSSKYLARKMVENINFDEAQCIVEYGPGTGVFTEKLLSKRNENTKILLIEMNEDFCKILKVKYENIQNLHIINDSAENTGKYLSEHGFLYADFIISGLPFASLPQEISENILAQTKKFLSPNGFFITFQYTLFKKKILTRFFEIAKIKHEMRNVPPAYVLTMKS